MKDNIRKISQPEKYDALFRAKKMIKQSETPKQMVMALNYATFAVNSFDNCHSAISSFDSTTQLIIAGKVFAMRSLRSEYEIKN